MARHPARYETRHAAHDHLGTHRHRAAYAALVLDGAYVEQCVDGPVACMPGTLLLHPRFHAHGNRFEAHGARVLNIELGDACRIDALIGVQVANPREARAVFAHGDVPALRELVAASPTIDRAPLPWQAAMLEALRATNASVGRIATDLGVSAAHATRAMTRAFGMGPAALRRELRWRHALRLLRGDASLADVALLAGFSDQSHFNRVARACSGSTPGRLRAQVNSIQDHAASMAQDAGNRNPVSTRFPAWRHALRPEVSSPAPACSHSH